MKRSTCRNIVGMCFGACIGTLSVTAMLQQNLWLLCITGIAVVGAVVNMLGGNAKD